MIPNYIEGEHIVQVIIALACGPLASSNHELMGFTSLTLAYPSPATRLCGGRWNMSRLCLPTAALALLAMVLSARAESPRDSQAAPPYPITVTGIRQEIKRKGAEVVLNELVYQYEAIDPVLEQAKKGDPQWLRLLADLRTGSHGETSSMLDTVMGAALEKSPGIALSLSHPKYAQVPGRPFPLDRVCQCHFDVEASEGKPRLVFTDEEKLATAKRRRAAVEAMSTKKLRKLRDRCLAVLDDSIRILTIH